MADLEEIVTVVTAPVGLAAEAAAAALKAVLDALAGK